MKKDRFPIFKNYPELVYLDNAATTQKPEVVIQSLVDFYSKYNSNVHRGNYPLSEKASEIYEDARVKVSKFINSLVNEIVFTSGTTDGMNFLARSLEKTGLGYKSVLISDTDHHSSILPWINSHKYNVSYISDNIPENKPYDIVVATLVSNVTGNILNISDLRNRFQPKLLILDVAQGVSHIDIDVKNLNADFILFSGHKMYGPMGIGVLWGKRSHLEKLEPFRVGGGMINEIKKDKQSWSDIPSRFEAGTPSVADAYALGNAIDFLNEVGIKNIREHENDLKIYLYDKLKEIDGINIYHSTENSVGVISFSHNTIHAHDIAYELGKRYICVRAGHHCTQMFHRDILKIPASVRISLGMYNTREDIDRLIKELGIALQKF